MSNETQTSVNSKEWIHTICDIPRKLQSDGYNCCVYVMNLMDHIGCNIPIEINFNPNQYRNYIAELLLMKSLSMKEMCLLCYQQGKDDMKIRCNRCQRFTYDKCFRRSNLRNKQLCMLCDPARKRKVTKTKELKRLESRISRLIW